MQPNEVNLKAEIVIHTYFGSGGPSARGFMESLHRERNTRKASFCRMWEKRAALWGPCRASASWHRWRKTVLLFMQTALIRPFCDVTFPKFIVGMNQKFGHRILLFLNWNNTAETGCCVDSNKYRSQQALVWIGANMSALWTYFNMSKKDPLIVLRGCICEEFPHVRFITWNPNIPIANLNMSRTGHRKGKSLWAHPRRLLPMYLKRFSSHCAKAKAPTQFYNLSAG